MGEKGVGKLSRETPPPREGEPMGAPTPVSKLGQGVPDVHRFVSSSLHYTESGEVSWPLCR